MKKQDLMKKKIAIAEKRILELVKSNDLKKISETERYQISRFYEEKSRNRIQTAKLIYNASKKSENYNDYSEAVAAAYYSMYYIVHAFLALNYRTKMSSGLRGVHIITEYMILYYLVRTKKLANYLYEEYLKAFETTAQIQKMSIDDFQAKAYGYAEKYCRSRNARETFTYRITLDVEDFNARNAINTAEEFISTIRQIMI